MSSMLIIGECMLELRTDKDNRLVKSFAGDTYNTAVYAKRYFPEADVYFLSAVGKDLFSQEMVSVWQSEGINTTWVQQSPDRQVGIYAIANDEHGERSFSYWRSGSAATQLMQLLDVNTLKGVHFDIIYFSGVSMSILSDEDKQLLIDFISAKRSEGCKVAFDPNYRPRMWRNKENTIEWLEKAYACSDIVLPGLDDHGDLLGQNTKDAIHAYMAKFGDIEQLIKCGKDGVYSYDPQNTEYHLPFTPAKQQVDSTAAGDSFAGTYLAARLKGEDILQAMASAARIAGIVVQHPGAIIDLASYHNG